MKISVAGLVLLTLLSIFGCSHTPHRQDTSIDNSYQTRLQSAGTLLDMMEMDASMRQAMEQMLHLQMQQNPNLLPFKQVMMRFFDKYMSYASLKPELSAIYANAYSQKELQELIAFYDTPTGRKTINLMPQLFQQAADVGRAKVQQNMGELRIMLEAEAQRLRDLQNL